MERRRSVVVGKPDEPNFRGEHSPFTYDAFIEATGRTPEAGVYGDTDDESFDPAELDELEGRAMLGDEEYEATFPGQEGPRFNIAALMGADGHIARVQPGYQVRPGQLTLALAIDAAFREGKNLLAEGPTGVGKSKAALIPAIAHAVHETRRAVYCTSSIMLQEQLAKKDLPDLERTLPWPFRWAVLKGTSNYVCRKQLLASQVDPEAQRDEHVFGVADWVETHESGDLADYHVELSALTKSRVTTTAEECTGQKCSEKDRCGMLAARRKAKAAHVVVVNYHLFFADLRVRRDNEDGEGILPSYQDVIFDEGHSVADIARSFLGFELSTGSLRWIYQRLMSIDPEAAKRIQITGDALFEALTTYARSKKYRARLHRQPYDPVSLQAIDYEALFHVLREASKSTMQAREALTSTDKETLQRRSKLQALATACDNRARELKEGMTLQTKDWCYYLKDEGRYGVALCGMPIHVADMLRQDVWKHSAVHSVVCMSATMTTGKGSFELVRTELGAEDAGELEVPSPFDWPNQALFVLPPKLPMPNEPAFTGAAALATVEVIKAAQGRTLGLFTSRKALEEVARVVRTAKLPYRVFVQGELPRGELVRRFKDDVSSVLLGTASLWEGVDVPGESCSAVVIDRIPFKSPDDPLADYWNDARKDSFMKWLVPNAMIDLRQGVGRLIRTPSDRGVIVLLDSRVLWGKPYGRKFLRAVPEGTPRASGEDWRERITSFLYPTTPTLESLFQ